MIATGKKVQVKKMKALTVIWRSYIFFLVFPPFSPIFYCFFKAMRKGFSRVSIIETSKPKQ